MMMIVVTKRNTALSTGTSHMEEKRAAPVVESGSSSSGNAGAGAADNVVAPPTKRSKRAVANIKIEQDGGPEGDRVAGKTTKKMLDARFQKIKAMKVRLDKCQSLSGEIVSLIERSAEWKKEKQEGDELVALRADLDKEKFKSDFWKEWSVTEDRLFAAVAKKQYTTDQIWIETHDDNLTGLESSLKKLEKQCDLVQRVHKARQG